MRSTIEEACVVCPFCNLKTLPEIKGSASATVCESCGMIIGVENNIIGHYLYQGIPDRMQPICLL